MQTDSKQTEGAVDVGSNRLLGDFGEQCLKDLMQGEWEPDWEWQDKMLRIAEKMGLIISRPVEPGDDIAEECDFIWERVKSLNDKIQP